GWSRSLVPAFVSTCGRRPYLRMPVLVELVDRPRARPLGTDVAFDDQLALRTDGHVLEPVLHGLRPQDERRVAGPGEQPAHERADDVHDQEGPGASELARHEGRAERAGRVEACAGQ